MTLRHLILSLGLYAAAFAFAWCVTWALCELHPVSARPGDCREQRAPMKPAPLRS